MDALLNDLRHSARTLRRSPGFTTTALAALALAIATNTAMFSVVNAVLLKPLPYPEARRVVMFQNSFPAGRSGSAAPTEFNWWRQQTQVFQDISAYDFGVANWTGESLPEQIPTMHVTADFFRLCGADALLGRTLAADDDLPNAPKTAVLAYAFWQRRFGGNPHVVGRRMTLSGERHEIVGVLGPRLQNGIAERSSLSGAIEIDDPPDVYLPFQIDRNSASHDHSFNVAGRLRPGVSLAAANAQLQASYAEFARRWPGIDSPGRGFAIQGLQAAVVGGVRNSLLILSVAVALVLLIACANVANLLLARAAGRKREIAIRAALGAARGRIVRRLLTESLMLSAAGGALGLAAGYGGIRAILSLMPGNIPRIGAGGANVVLDWRVAGFTMGLSILTGIVFGLAPALESSRGDLSATLHHRDGGRHDRGRELLVATEVALAVVLSIGAALLIRSFLAIRQVNPGFDGNNVLTMRMSMTGPAFERAEGARQIMREGLRRVRALPGVEAAASSCCVPLEDKLHGAFRIVGRPDGPWSGGLTGWTLVSAGYFETLRIPVLQGRIFTERDESGPPVVMINETAARRFWRDRDPLKDQIVMGNGIRRQIVGVARDVREEALIREPRPMVYVPTADGGSLLRIQPWAWLIRTRGAPLPLSAAIQKELREATTGLPAAQARTMEQILWRSRAAENFNTLVLTIFGCTALLLAAIGIYGLMACTVAQRTHEIGIRVAVGAESSDIRKLVVYQGVRPAVAGMVCGLAAAFGLARLIAGILFGVKPWDPLVFSTIPVLLMGVALVAVWLPARRASRVDPMEALRHER